MARTFIKGFLKALCVISIYIEQAQSQGIDLTLVPEAFNTSVVGATVQKISHLAEISDDLRTDNRFIRRIALVETEDGTAPSTFSNPNYHGGIWRVDSSIFDITKQMFNQAEYSSLFKDIINILCISWGQATWEDCRKPLYSALAARLYFHKLNPTIPLGLDSQAQLWANNYHDQPSGTRENFAGRVPTVESEERCPARGINIVFVLDGSGSVGSTNFNKTKSFVLEMVDSFNIGPDQTRVGVIQYGSWIDNEFSLNDFTDQDSLTQAVSDIVYNGGGTFTGAALSFMANESFQLATPLFPKVAVVITDGMSLDNVSEPAESAREKGIVIFAIGVTDNIDYEELKLIADDPDDRYVFSVNDFDAIDNIKAALEFETCRQAATITNEISSGTVNEDEIQNFKRAIFESGITLILEATSGNTIMYVSTTTPNPNSALHDAALIAREGQGISDIFIGPDFVNRTCMNAEESARKRRQVSNAEEDEPGTQIGTVYITIEGLEDTNDFVLMVAEGDVTKPTTATLMTTVTMTTVDTNGCDAMTMTAACVFAIALHAVIAAQFT